MKESMVFWLENGNCLCPPFIIHTGSVKVVVVNACKRRRPL